MGTLNKEYILGIHDKKRISRLISLITSLQTKNMITATELADRFSVSVRTIYRDLEALEEAGIPIYTEEGRGYKLIDDYQLPPVSFSEEEANALILGEQLIHGSPDSSLIDNYGSAVEKIKAVLPVQMKEKADLLTGRTRFEQNLKRDRSSDNLSDIQKALVDHNLVSIDYIDGEGRTTSRMIEPFALLSTNGNWLLVAKCRLREEFRYFRLDRIAYSEVLKESFEPHKMTLQEYFEKYY